MPACDRAPFVPTSTDCRDECTRTTNPLDNDGAELRPRRAGPAQLEPIIPRMPSRWDRLFGWHTIGYHVPKVTTLHRPGSFFVTTTSPVPGTVRAAGVLVGL